MWILFKDFMGKDKGIRKETEKEHTRKLSDKNENKMQEETEATSNYSNNKYSIWSRSKSD